MCFFSNCSFLVGVLQNQYSKLKDARELSVTTGEGMLIPVLKKFHGGVLEISCSQESKTLYIKKFLCMTIAVPLNPQASHSLNL